MDYFKNLYFNYYSLTKYSCLDISDQLLLQCRTLLQQDHGGLIANQRVGFINADVSEYEQPHDEPVLFVLFEILDNLPHDKVLIDTHLNLAFQR